VVSGSSGSVGVRCLSSSVVDDEYALMHQLHGSSVTHRIVVGLRQGCNVFTLRTLPASDLEEWGGMVDGFSLHTGVAAKVHEHNEL